MKTQTENTKLSENEVRPDKLQSGMERAMKKDIKRMNSRKKDFIGVNCPACNSKKRANKFKKSGMNIVECLECESYYMNPRPTLDVLDWYYKDSAVYDFWNKYVYPTSYKARKEKITVPRVNMVIDLCKKFKVKTGSLLEIGAGDGTFCEEMIKKNVFKDVVAVEPVPSLAQTCRDRGVRTIGTVIEKIKFKKKELFDVAINFEVIDILFSPKDFVLGCKKSLKKGGLFVFSLRNNKGFDINVLGAKSSSVIHSNMTLFNPKSIKLLLKRCGFETVSVFTPGKLDAEIVRKKILSGAFDVSKKPFLKQVLIDEWDTLGDKFQKFLYESNLSSHMMVVAKKR